MLHFRRAMVLAHRGGHWACLQWVCRMLWDQASVADQLLGWAAPIPEQSCPLSLEHLHATLTPVLLLASHCLLDMIQRLQEPPATLQVQEPALGALGGDEGDSSLHFSSPLDDGTVVSLRWVSTLTLRTLELLHLQGRWESLAHLAILFNSITNERYTHLVTPLLVYAQRRLLERVHQFGGPQPPQPHFTRAEEISGERITCRNFIGHQLVIGSAGKEEVHPGSYIDPKGHDIYSGGRRAMVLVSVPLDVADTLCCFRKTMDRGHYHSRALQHSRSLLWLLLAHTQHGGDTQCSRGSTSQSHGRLVFNIAASSAPAASPTDLSAEDFSSLSALYSSTLPHSQLPTVVMSYTNTIEFLQANNQDSLTVQALHELGNLYFYSGNKRGSWDGGGEGSNLPQIFLRKAGIWGCLQGAVLSAKIAQYTLTCAISQQTHCCILSALLFKALLWGSLPHPLLDWEYCSYSLGLAWDIPELLPGVELFSEPHRAQVGTTVSSLAFVCQRLYSAGHSLLVLPLLSLYLYFVSTVCRDQRRTIEGRIMKVQALTELCLFAEAMRELGSLLQGERIPQPHGNYCPTNKCLTKNKFDTSKPLLDSANLQTLEELVNRPLTPELSALYGPRLVKRLTLAKTQLVIALCDTVHGYPESPAQGVVERKLVSLGECGPQAALNSLLEAVSVTRSHNNNLLTPLHIACAFGHADIVHFLGAKNAELNLLDNKGRTPLVTAVEYQQEHCVVELLDHNANPNLADINGNTALHLTAMVPSIPLAELLLRHGASINAKNKAVQSEQECCVLSLLKHKADPNLADINGNTALHFAAFIPSIPLAGHLLRNGASINAKNKEGCSPLHLAVSENHLDMVSYLLSKVADINASDNSSRTPLMIAANNGYFRMISMLLWHFADDSIKDNSGWTANDHAVMNRHYG
ncbi:CFA54 protein, partial [Amia calva]|nr:CFA54 protein [Amia calva]